MKQEYFINSEGLEKLLIDYKEVFDLLDDISQQLLQGIIATVDQYKEVLNQATGAYGTLEPLYSLAIAHKENLELHYYVEKKRELEGKGEKVVATSLDKESSESVAQIRRIRNILEGYVSVSEKIIITAQTQMKQLSQDYKYKPQEENK
jgi:ribosomal protein L20